MKIFFVVFSFILFQAVSSFAQDFKKESLNVVLLTAKQYQSNGKTDSAIVLLNQVILKAEKERDAEIAAAAKLSLGRIYADKGDNVKAFKIYNEALDKAESIADKSLIAHIYKNIGAVYISWKKFDHALKYYNKAEALARTLNDDELIADCQNNKGTVYEQQKMYDKAIIAYKNAYNSYSEKKIIPKISMALSNLAIVYKFQKNYQESLKYNLIALQLSTKTGDKWMQAATYNNIGNLYGEMGKYALAIQYCDKALVIAKKIDAIEIVECTYDSMSEAALKVGDYKKALEYRKLFSAYNDKFINAENTKQLAELNVKFETANKEKLIQQQQFEISKKNFWLYGSFTVLFLAFIIGYFVLKNIRYRQGQLLQTEIINQRDISVKAVLQAEENERKRIAANLHDGLGQMFSTVKLNLSGLENQVSFKDETVKANFLKTINLVDSSCKELRTISHQMASEILINLGIIAAIKDFVQNIDQSKLKVNFQAIGVNERIAANVETVLYRVVQESVNNVIKHAKATNLDIQLLKENDELTLIIEDNGIGFNIHHNNGYGGMGLKNIQSRVAYLKGTVDFDSAPNRGTVISIYVPLT